jgi:membrane protein
MQNKHLKALTERVVAYWQYCSQDVWHDQRRKWWIDLIKTINLSVRSFFNSDMQSQACAMTYRTLLAIVPALALLFAIGRGFGLQNVIQDELMQMFPAQKEAVSMALNFVDSYLSQSSEGIFLGIGIVFLLWTLISLLGNIESSFNLIWGVKQGRSLGRKITDYTSMLLILPIVLICASGLSLLLSSTLRTMFHFSILSPMVSWIIECSSWVLTWLFFALLYVLIPNTKVKFVNALISGVFAGSGFRILQWIFVSGQMYVTKYNAIYGSMSFLPLMLIWLQFTYVIIFAGGVICYSAQSIFMFNFHDAIKKMSSGYYSKLVIAIGAVVTQRFTADRGATTVDDIVKGYNMPPNLVSMICDKLVSAGVLSVVEIDSKEEIKGYQPALEPCKITIAEVYSRMEKTGASDFIPGLDSKFPGVKDACDKISSNEFAVTSNIKLTDIKIKTLS